MGVMEELRTALAGSLSSLAANMQVSPYTLSSPTPPAADVEPAPIKYDLAMQRGLDKWAFTVRVYVGYTADIGAQKLLDQYIDPTGPLSVKTLLEADRELGGVCDHVQVTECSGYRVYTPTHSGQATLGCEWTVEVHVSSN